MNIRTRSSIPGNKKVSGDVTLDESLLSLSDEDIGFQNYYQKKIEQEDIDDGSETEIQIRTRWNRLKNSRKRKFVKISGVTSFDRKGPLSEQSSSDENITVISSISCGKKTKVDLNVEKEFFQLEVQRLIASPAQYSFQPVCQVCESFLECSSVIKCTGVCLRYFHRKCLDYPSEKAPPPENNFQCPDCWNNTYSCILCKRIDKITALLNCENSDCGRLYHKACLNKSNFVCHSITEERIKSCPAHHCVTCAREDPSCIKEPCEKMFQCIRCPAAFHDAELCMAAGSVELSLSHVICPRHFETNLIKSSTYKPFHPGWCFICFKSGAKLLCTLCPSSFHPDCIDQKLNRRDNVFVCPDCSKNRQPRYGEIVFVKASHYRWWPAEIIHPRNAPMNILRMKRPDGTFPILFLGSQEYQWMARSRSICYNVAVRSSIVKDSGGGNKMDREFTVGLERAATMHKVFVNILLKYVPLTSISAECMSQKEIAPFVNYQDDDQRAIKYQSIKANVLVPPAQLPLGKSSSVCDCSMRCQSFLCRNYLNKVECDKDVCLAKDGCDNRLFSNHVKRNLGVTKTGNRGFGLRTMDSLKEHEFVIEYLGEVITSSESAARISVAKKRNVKDTYMVRLAGDVIIDGGPKGNLSRYINHACDPNCRVERWTVQGYVRLGIFASRDIASEEELTFDYRVSGSVLKEDAFCLCNGVTCTGFLGPESAATVMAIKARMPPSDVDKRRGYSRRGRQRSHVGGKGSVDIADMLGDPKMNPVLQLEHAGSVDILAACEEPCPGTDPVKEVVMDDAVGLCAPVSPRDGSTSTVRDLHWGHRIDDLIEDCLKRPYLCTDSVHADDVTDVSHTVNKDQAGHSPVIKVISTASLKVRRRHVQGGHLAMEDDRVDDVVSRSVEDHSAGENVVVESLELKKDVVESLKVKKDVAESLKVKKDIAVSLKVKKDVAESLKVKKDIAESLKVTKDVEESLELKKKTSGIQKRKLQVVESLNLKNDAVDADERMSVRKCREETDKVDGNYDSETDPIKIDNVKRNYKKDHFRKNRIKNANKEGKEDATRSVGTDVMVNDVDKTEVDKDIFAETDAISECIRETDAVIESMNRVILIKEFSATPGAEYNRDPCDHASQPPKKDVVYESFCYRCFDGGQLMLCDKRGCTKTYHLSCLGLKKTPSGTWYCPWHFCDVCGDPSYTFCVQCPSSYCQSHIEEGCVFFSPSTSRLSLCVLHSQGQGEVAALRRG